MNHPNLKQNIKIMHVGNIAPIVKFKFKTTKSSLCNNCDAYLLVKETIIFFI